MSAVFTQRVDEASNTRWLDGRLVQLRKPEKVEVSFWTLHPDDDCEYVWSTFQMSRNDTAACVLDARREGRRVVQSVKGWEIES